MSLNHSPTLTVEESLAQTDAEILELSCPPDGKPHPRLRSLQARRRNLTLMIFQDRAKEPRMVQLPIPARCVVTLRESPEGWEAVLNNTIPGPLDYIGPIQAGLGKGLTPEGAIDRAYTDLLEKIHLQNARSLREAASPRQVPTAGTSANDLLAELGL